MRLPGRLDNRIGSRIPICQFAVFMDIDVVQRPRVLERGPAALEPIGAS